jgi:hypothetical protein
MHNDAPRYETRLRFAVGAALPPDQPLAQWIVNVARALNDLLLANERLRVGFEEGTPAYEHFYDIRAIATHAWELDKFLRESERDSDQVRDFIAAMPEEAVRHYRNADQVLQGDPEQEEIPERRRFKRPCEGATPRGQRTPGARSIAAQFAARRSGIEMHGGCPAGDRCKKVLVCGPESLLRFVQPGDVILRRRLLVVEHLLVIGANCFHRGSTQELIEGIYHRIIRMRPAYR